MATTKRIKTAKQTIDDDKIISLYMNDVLEKNAEPTNVFSFCKNYAIEESDFYSFFGSFDSLKQAVWVKFFENADMGSNSKFFLRIVIAVSNTSSFFLLLIFIPGKKESWGTSSPPIKSSGCNKILGGV